MTFLVGLFQIPKVFVFFSFFPSNTCYSIISNSGLMSFPGSNTHNNGAPGGDGQTGDAGEGRGGQYSFNHTHSHFLSLIGELFYFPYEYNHCSLA